MANPLRLPARPAHRCQDTAGRAIPRRAAAFALGMSDRRFIAAVICSSEGVGMIRNP